MTRIDSNILAKRAIDALRMMYRGSIEQVRDVRPSLSTDADSRIATVNLTGSPSYRITVAANARGGIALAQAMFESTEQEVTGPMIDDAMCELANMTAGQVKGLIAQTHRVDQLGIVTGDKIDRNAKTLSGTCLRLLGGGSEISILLAEMQVASTGVTGAKVGAVGRKAETIASSDEPASKLELPIAKGTSTELSRRVDPRTSAQLFLPTEPCVLVELSAPRIDTPLEEISSHPGESPSDPSATIVAANAGDIGEGAYASATDTAAEGGVDVMSIVSDRSANVVGEVLEPEISVPAMIDDASKAFLAEGSTALADTVDSQAATASEAAETQEHLAQADSRLDYGTVDETALETESAQSPMQPSTSSAQSAQCIPSHAPCAAIDASICVEDPVAAEAAPDAYLSVSTSADSMAQEQFVSIRATHVVDAPVTVRPTRGRRPSASTDDRLRVMIAQGNDAHLKVIRRAVLSRNMRLVAIARDGEEAVSETLRAKPDLLCLDLDLARQDGLQALTRIRSELPTLTVAVVSASATMPQVRRAMELQVVSIIVRPLTHSRLTAELARIAPFTLPGDSQLRAPTDMNSQLMSDRLPYLQ